MSETGRPDIQEKIDWELLLETATPLIRRKVMSVLGKDYVAEVEDVVMDVLSRLLTYQHNIPKSVNEKGARNYIAMVARNVAFDRVRALERKGLHEVTADLKKEERLLVDEQAQRSILDKIDKQEQLTLVLESLVKDLTGDERQLLDLVYVGHSFEEIAAMRQEDVYRTMASWNKVRAKVIRLARLRK